MSIRVVTDMPSNLKKVLKETDRDKVLKDFQEALNNHVKVFEFTGDYNFKTLSQKAKEVARRRVFFKIYRDAAKKVEEVLSKEFPDEKYLCATDYNYYADKFFKVKNVKENNEIHVYASIDYRFIDGLYDKILYDTRLHYQLKGEQND